MCWQLTQILLKGSVFLGHSYTEPIKRALFLTRVALQPLHSRCLFTKMLSFESSLVFFCQSISGALCTPRLPFLQLHAVLPIAAPGPSEEHSDNRGSISGCCVSSARMQPHAEPGAALRKADVQGKREQCGWTCSRTRPGAPICCAVLSAIRLGCHLWWGLNAPIGPMLGSGELQV